MSGLAAITSGRGADHIFLAAGGRTNGPVEAAVKLARDRARVVDIGKMKLDLPWNAYYEKELDVRFSRSYGPAGTTAGTSSRASTTRSGTSGGPRSATWSPSWSCWPAIPSRWRASSTASSRSATPRRCTATSRTAPSRPSGSCWSTSSPPMDAPKPATSKVLPGAKAPSVRNGR